MVRNLLGRVAIAAGGGYAAREAVRVLSLVPGTERFGRHNRRGRRVSLVGGPALTVGATAAGVAGAGAVSGSVAAAALVAGLGSGLVGGYDDLVGARPRRVTSGLVKVVGVGVAALVAAALLPDPARRTVAGRAVDVALAAGVIGGTANLVGLLDVRPGRALEASLVLGVPLAASVRRDDVAKSAAGLAAGVTGAAGGLLPADLDEEVMLGDAGANALGALLGVAYAARTGRAGRLAALVALAALTIGRTLENGTSRR
jgi:UDP-N-acetylmuramyl pentapeptide phosphotransferase/UDP-N-acetylglucosamine-1-phosphate transferase